MGIPTNIKTLISGNVVEWARIEFKETWDAEASLKTICAFANDIDNWGGGFYTDPERLSFATTLFIHPDFLKVKNSEFDGNDGNSDGNDGNSNLSLNEVQVLEIIAQYPTLSASKIGAKINVSKSTVERCQKNLKDKGIIKREGSTRGKWIILK